MAIVYVETNFLLSIATGQDAEASALLADTPAEARLVIPSVCFMEALSALEGKRRERIDLERRLKQEVFQLQRDVTSTHAHQLQILLDQARAENTHLIQDINTRLFDAMRLLVGKAEMIDPTAAIVEAGLGSDLLRDAPTDGLIFFSILEHARSRPAEPKAFLSANVRDYGGEEIRRALLGAGVEKYFAGAKDALGWLKSPGSA